MVQYFVPFVIETKTLQKKLLRYIKAVHHHRTRHSTDQNTAATSTCFY